MSASYFRLLCCAVVLSLRLVEIMCDLEQCVLDQDWIFCYVKVIYGVVSEGFGVKNTEVEAF